jgi:hypothetical protein
VGCSAKGIEGVFEARLEIIKALLEGKNTAHEDFAGPSAGITLGAEAELASGDQRAQCPLGEVVFRKDSPIVSPATRPFGVEAPRKMSGICWTPGWRAECSTASRMACLVLLRISIELCVADRQSAKTHGVGREASECAPEGLNSRLIRKFLLKVLELARHMSVAVLEPTRGFVVGVPARGPRPGIAIDGQVPRERFFAEHLFRRGCRARLAKTEAAPLFRAEQSRVAILTICAPGGLVGVIHRSLPILLD